MSHIRPLFRLSSSAYAGIRTHSLQNMSLPTPITTRPVLPLIKSTNQGCQTPTCSTNSSSSCDPRNCSQSNLAPSSLDEQRLWYGWHQISRPILSDKLKPFSTCIDRMQSWDFQTHSALLDQKAGWALNIEAEKAWYHGRIKTIVYLFSAALNSCILCILFSLISLYRLKV